MQHAADVQFNQLETVDYANLASALIKLCLHDGEDASQVLSVKLSNINAQLNSLKIKLDEGMETDSMRDNVNIAIQELVQAFMELQFFDRISQRLDHAAHSAELVVDPAADLDIPIYDRFTMEDERVLYNALLEGARPDEAVEKATEKLDDTLDKSSGDDIELF